MEELKATIAKILRESDDKGLQEAKEIAETFVKQVSYRLMSPAELNARLFNAAISKDVKTLLDISRYAVDPETREHARDELRLPGEQKPTRSLFQV